ncbi:hypothetical protein [Novosphingobium resinovorum]|uniref:Uncharacterized protein n=1 Tax=Novosphingobium resinovorum TaxID=158500 RepID=A0A1D8A551_9SPHN|nr:hypothetical protein [Novosphingobium resinovorum]AOR77222.1 hypothetical protein BES08_11015 [Novosphingobium resinovorum]
MTQYRAITRGQSSDGRWRQAGEVFNDDGPKGAWMQELDKDGKPVPDKKKSGKAGKSPAAPAPSEPVDAYSKLKPEELKAEAVKRKIAADGLDDEAIIKALREADAEG